MNNKEVMQQALEALERAVPTGEITLADWMKADTDLRAALAEPEQHADPTDPGHDVDVLREHVRHLERRVRELAPPQRKPLTDEEIDAACAGIECSNIDLGIYDRLIARAAVAAFCQLNGIRLIDPQ